MAKIVVVGGVAAGASAAVKARRTDESAEIVMFERGRYVSWANCGLPYFVGGEISAREDLILVTEQRFDQRFNIQVKCLHDIQQIDRVKKTVQGMNLISGETFTESYDKLILATGSRPIVPKLPGIHLPGIFTVTTIPEAEKLRDYIEAPEIKKAVVIGGGFIGMECLEALLKQGIKTTLVEGIDHILPPFDTEMVTDIHKYMAKQGITLVLGDKVAGFSGENAVKSVQLASGKTLEADFVVLSIGVQPQTTLATEAGLKVGETGGILVDDQMLSSDPDIFAAGDAVESVNWVTGKKSRFALAGPANKQGRVAGANAVGGKMTFTGAVGSSIVRVGHMVAGKTGISEREAKLEELDYFVSYVHPHNHAGYYPGGRGMTIKLVAEKGSGRILGAQVVGYDGVDKRVDVFATAIYARMTVLDLENFDLSYSPPFASAKDPSIQAGFVAANILRGEVNAIVPTELEGMLQRKEELILIDVRTPQEYERCHIDSAINIPLDGFRSQIGEIDKNKQVVVYCGVGYRSYLAYKILAGNGFTQVINLSGGITSWFQWVDRGAEIYIS